MSDLEVFEQREDRPDWDPEIYVCELCDRAFVHADQLYDHRVQSPVEEARSVIPNKGFVATTVIEPGDELPDGITLGYVNPCPGESHE